MKFTLTFLLLLLPLLMVAQSEYKIKPVILLSNKNMSGDIIKYDKIKINTRINCSYFDSTNNKIKIKGKIISIDSTTFNINSKRIEFKDINFISTYTALNIIRKAGGILSFCGGLFMLWVVGHYTDNFANALISVPFGAAGAFLICKKLGRFSSESWTFNKSTLRTYRQLKFKLKNEQRKKVMMPWTNK